METVLENKILWVFLMKVKEAFSNLQPTHTVKTKLKRPNHSWHYFSGSPVSVCNTASKAEEIGYFSFKSRETSCLLPTKNLKDRDNEANPSSLTMLWLRHFCWTTLPLTQTVLCESIKFLKEKSMNLRYKHRYVQWRLKDTSWSLKMKRKREKNEDSTFPFLCHSPWLEVGNTSVMLQMRQQAE